MGKPASGSTQKSSSVPTEQRQWDRQEYQTGMILVLEGGRTYEGQTLNVSPGGIFLNIQPPFDPISPREAAQLHISPHKGSPYFPCTVCRVGEDGVGLEFASDQATFGAYISHDMLLNLIGKINNAFAYSLDLKTTIETSVDEIKKHLQAEGSSLFLLNPERDSVICSACSGPVDISGLIVSIDEGIVGRTVRERSPQTVHNVSGDPFFTKAIDQLTGFETVSLLCAPMVIHGEVLGALEVVNKRGTGFFTKSDEVTLMALASSTALAIHNARQATDVIEKEAKIRASDMNYAFISSLNHKLHTPLNSVLGFAQLLETDETVMASSLGKDAVHQIISAGQNLMNVVDAILTFAELESGKITLNISPLPPLDTYEACLEAAQEAARHRQISIRDDGVDTATFNMIMADGVHFKQVMMHIFNHAVCSSPEHGTVTLSSSVTDALLRFSVIFENQCPDIPNIAVPFTPKSKCGEMELSTACTGLELAITNKLVELMNGEIEMQKQDGDNMRIWFQFPVA